MMNKPVPASPAQKIEFQKADNSMNSANFGTHIREAVEIVKEMASPAQISDEPKEKYILIGTGEGAYSAVVDDLRDGLHGFMCFCGQSLVACKHEDTLEMLKEMEDDDNWSVDEAGRRHQYSFEGYCYAITVTILRSRLEPVEAAKDEHPLADCEGCNNLDCPCNAGGFEGKEAIAYSDGFITGRETGYNHCGSCSHAWEGHDGECKAHVAGGSICGCRKIITEVAQ